MAFLGSSLCLCWRGQHEHTDRELGTNQHGFLQTIISFATSGRVALGQTRPRGLSAGAVVAWPVFLSKRTHSGAAGSGSLGPDKG
jgi:hypothetical protein